MSRMKDLWIQQYERLCAEFQERNPHASDRVAEKYAELNVDAACADAMADAIDQARDLCKERGL